MKKSMKQSFLLSTFLLSMMAASAHAVTLDYRHEYLIDDETHGDRFKVSHRFDNNFGFGLEGKWASKAVDGNSRMYDNLISKGVSLEGTYRYAINKQWVLDPSMSMESNSNSSTYKFNFKVSYNITSALTVGAKYRYGTAHFDRSEKVRKDTKHYHQGNFTIGYKFSSFSVGYDFEVKKTDYPAWKGKERDYSHNVNIQVPISKEWVPYGEIGYIPYKDGHYKKNGVAYANDWQWRVRLGIKYNF